MASWMVHLRVAEKLLSLWQIPDEERFILGNMAPDSGVPVEGGYEPSAAVSHFRAVDANGIKAVHEELFVEACFSEEKRKVCDDRAWSFYLGYLTHLITDRLWSKHVAYPAKERFDQLFREDKAAFWRMVKQDWYDMDFMFLQAHPDFQAWHTYTAMTDMGNDYLDFFSRTAFADRRAWIVDFYREGAANVQPRDAYLTWEAWNGFVEEAAAEIDAQLREMHIIV